MWLTEFIIYTSVKALSPSFKACTLSADNDLLSDDYVLDISHSTDEYNIIPCGTIFIVSENEPDDFNDVRIIKNQIEEYFKDKDYKNLIVICSTQKSYNSFLDYLGVPYEK